MAFFVRLLILICFVLVLILDWGACLFCFLAFDSGFKSWNSKGDSSWLEQVSLKFYNVAEDQLYIAFFKCLSKYHEMHCYRKSLAFPKASPFLREEKGQSSPESTQERVMALLLYKLCSPIFLIFSLTLVLFVLF